MNPAQNCLQEQSVEEKSLYDMQIIIIILIQWK